MTKIEEIYEAVLPEMAKHGIEDTIENRLACLTGLRDGWNEDPDIGLEKAWYQLALDMEITLLSLRLRYQVDTEGAS